LYSDVSLTFFLIFFLSIGSLFLSGGAQGGMAWSYSIYLGDNVMQITR
jgi:hypothetical protein